MELSLVRELAKYPILYDTTREEYKHVELKNQAWRRITCHLFQSEDAVLVERVKNKWKNLRDTFVKSQRRKDRGNGRPWKLEAEMKFLIPHIAIKGSPTIGTSTAGNGSILFQRLVSSSPDQLTKMKREDECMMDEFMPVEAVMEVSPRGSGSRSSREQFRHFLDSPYQSPLREEQVQYDHVDSFFLGLAQQVKQLKPREQVLLKKAISNLVFDAEYQSLESCEASSSS